MNPDHVRLCYSYRIMRPKMIAWHGLYSGDIRLDEVVCVPIWRGWLQWALDNADGFGDPGWV